MTNNGQAFNGGSRHYFDHLTYINFLGVHFWNGLISQIIKNKPEIVIITASPRNFSAWIIHIISKIIKFKLIGWSKINSDKTTSNRIKKKIKSIFYSNFDHLILYGEKSRKELINIGVKDKKICVALNTIDTNFYKKNKFFVDQNIIKLKKTYKLDNIKNKFLCLGRMINEKRQIDIINAWKLSNIDKKNSKLFFVGSGPNHKKIRQIIKNGDESIIFVGNVPWGFDYVWLSISDYTVFGGALGLACQQAFLMKSLVIAPYEDSSDSEFLNDNVNSILFEKENINQLAKIFFNVVRSTKKNNGIILEAYRYITKERSIGKMAEKFNEAIDL